MKKWIIIAVIFIVGLLSGYVICCYSQAPLYDAEPYQPFSVLIKSNSVDENTESVALAEYSGIEKLYLEDNVALIDEPSTEVTEEPKTYTAQDILKMAGISLAVGIVIALIVCLIMKSCMKTARPKHTANDYIKKNSFHITRSRDIFIYAELSKRKRVNEESKK
mgnify:CR=1 FL=1